MIPSASKNPLNNTVQNNADIKILESKERKSHSSQLGFIDGAIVGVITMLFRHPFQMIYLKTQTDLDKSVFRVIKDTKFQHLTNGLGGSVLVASIKRGSSFYMFSLINNVVNTSVKEPFSSAISGMCVGAMGTLLLSCPLEAYLMYRTYNVNDPNSKGPIRYLIMKAKAGQLRDLWKAAGPHCLQTAVFQASWFSSYRSVKGSRIKDEANPDYKQKALDHMTSTTLASVNATAIATPFHTITARQNLMVLKGEERTIWQLVKEIAINEGLRGFGRGGLIPIFRSGLNGVVLGSILFGVDIVKEKFAENKKTKL